MRSSLNTAEQYVGLSDMGCRECPDDSSDIRNFNEMVCFSCSINRLRQMSPMAIYEHSAFKKNENERTKR